MTARVEPDSSALPVLVIPEEPLDAKVRLRAFVGEDPVAGRAAAVGKVTDLLWDEWKEVLVPFGVDAERFSSVVVGATHEVWLWVMGDRPYDQLVASVIGRTVRRRS